MLAIQNNYSLLHYNTFHLDVKAGYFVEIISESNLLSLMQDPIFQTYSHFILGGGSNLLLTKDYDGLIVKNHLKGMHIISETEDSVLIQCASGEFWNDLVQFCVERNLGGIENLSLIPGTVGAAPIQNIGAYGVELKDVFVELNAFHLQHGTYQIFNYQDCEFGYRDSIFKHSEKGKWFIVSVTLKLQKNPIFKTTYGAIQQTLNQMNVQRLSVQSISDAVVKIRKSKLPDPNVLGNAGSFFKNPTISKTQYDSLKLLFNDIPGYVVSETEIKIPAGWLIEQCGWKGKVVGNTGAHKDQSLVLVNYGNATGNEIYSLAIHIQQSVFNKFKIEIEPEVNIL